MSKLASTGTIGHLLHGSGASDPPEVIRLEVPQFLDAVLMATGRLAHDVETAGVPKIKDGPAIAAVFANSVQVVTVVVTTFRDRARQLAPNQPGDQFHETQDLASVLQALGATLQDTTSKAAGAYPSSGIGKAFASAKACKPLL